LRRQFQATSDDESMGWLAERRPEGAREVRFTALNERAEISDAYRLYNMTIDIVADLARLPGEQACSGVLSFRRDMRIDLLSQQ
jgi:hypothetical protein